MDDPVIHVSLDLPQLDWPSDKNLALRFYKWQAEFERLHNREPGVVEMLECAYQEGVRDGTERTLEA